MGHFGKGRAEAECSSDGCGSVHHTRHASIFADSPLLHDVEPEVRLLNVDAVGLDALTTCIVLQPCFCDGWQRVAPRGGDKRPPGQKDLRVSE